MIAQIRYWTVAVLCIVGTYASAQFCPLDCIGDLFVDFHATCEIEITIPDVLFESQDPTCPVIDSLSFVLFDQFGNIVPNSIITTQYAGQIIQVEVYNPSDESTCWTYISVSEHISSCKDYLEFPTDCEGFWIDGTIGGPDWQNDDPSYCQGDTVRGFVRPYIASELTAPLDISRINFNNGEIVDIQDTYVDIYLPVSGVGTVDFFNGVDTQYVDLNVSPQRKLEIMSEGQPASDLSICTGDQLVFSSNIFAYDILWELSNGLVYSSNDIEIEFDTPGNYELVLSNTDDCKCQLSDTINIEVMSGASPTITCLGTVCANDVNVYYSDSECDSYVWSVSSEGLIVDGGGPQDYFVQVQWNSGQEGNISLSTPDCFSEVCRETTTETIPIISSTASISGPTEVCVSSVTTYSIPDYKGTDFTWTINENGVIRSGANTNEIAVEWIYFYDTQGAIQPEQAEVMVMYESCSGGCNGSATLPVTILPNIFIQGGETSICSGDNITISNNHGIDVDWQIIEPSGATNDIVASTVINESLSEIGMHTIIMNANASNFCEPNDTVYIDVHPNPILSGSIIGDSLICFGEINHYRIDNVGEDEIVKWQIFDGSSFSPSRELVSDEIEYVWSSAGPYQLRATLHNQYTGCTSQSTSLTLNNMRQIVRTDTTCQGVIRDYKFDEHNSGVISWEIQPSNAGAIVGQNDDEVSVLWNDVNNAKLIARDCNTILEVDIELAPWQVSVVFDDLICPNTTTTFQVVADDISEIQILTPLGTEVANSNNIELSPGRYNVFVTSEFGCEYFEEVVISRISSPLQILSTDKSLGFCPPLDVPFRIWVENPILGDTYQWYHDGALLPDVGFEIFAMDIGVYSVVATSTDGCVRAPSSIVFYNNCGSTLDGLPPQIDGSLIVRIPSLGHCDNPIFWVDPNDPNAEYTWDFGDGSTAIGDTVSHQYTTLGTYEVVVTSDQNCVLTQPDEILECPQIREEITIELVADFIYSRVCEGEAVTFIDRSRQLNNTIGLSYLWDFGDPTSGDNSSTSANPNHLFTGPGPFEVTLQVTNDNGCISTITKEVILFPQYEIDIEAPNHTCIASPVPFSVNSNSSPLSYEWDFGDSTPATSPDLVQDSPIHSFDQFGIYEVTLQTTNSNGCIQYDTIVIEVSGGALSGEIASSMNNPLCFGDSTILTAPMDGVSYLWSNGATTNEIEVGASGSYAVTITDSIGCEYIPDPYSVIYEHSSPIEIVGISRPYVDGFQEYNVHRDSMTVCLGDYFVLQATELDGYIYTWSNSVSDNPLAYYPHLNNLPPERHVFSVEAMAANSNCVLEDSDFVVNIVAPPSEPIIEIDQSVPCESDINRLSVTNPEAGVEYIWSNGAKGVSILTSVAGFYSVEAVNEAGCISASSSIRIYKKPYLSGWFGGCFEQCFPYELCADLGGASSYELIKDGVVIQTLTNASSITLDSPGDYQINAISYRGCTSLSDILSVESVPDDHSLSGIVYYDENENSVFDGDDVLLENMLVNVMVGNTIVLDTLTDINGAYNFQNIGYSNTQVVLDLVNAPYTLYGDLDSLLLFDSCLQHKIVDIPLVRTCQEIKENRSFTICQSDSILLYGQYYYAEDVDTIRVPIEQDCDSILAIRILAPEEPVLDLMTSKSCTGENNGKLHIINNTSGSFDYYLNNQAIDISDTIRNLAPGEYVLEVRDGTSCSYITMVNVDALTNPEIEIFAENACEDIDNGAITINSNSLSSAEYSIDGINYSSNLYYDGLSVGDHMLYASFDNGCMTELPFTIAAVAVPQVAINENLACNGIADGAIDIEILEGNDLSFALDNTDVFTNELEFSGLAQGDYILYVKYDNACMIEVPFAINEIPAIDPEVSTRSACPDESNGIVYLLDNDLQWTLDINEAFQTLDSIAGLAVGNYMAYAQDINGCLDSVQFSIDAFAPEEVIINTTMACENLSQGSITITGPLNMMYSLDGVTYNSDIQIDNLDPGDYVLYAQDANRCVQEIPFQILEQPVPDYQLQAEASCQGTSTGQVEIISDNPDLQYSINGGELSSVQSWGELAEGMYYVSIAWANCVYEDSIAVESFDLPNATFSTEPSCTASATGQLLIEKDNPSDIIIYQNEEYPDQSNFENLPIGQHSFEIVDANGCVNDFVAIVDSLPVLAVEVNIPDQDCYTNQLIIEPVVNSSTGEVSFEWQDGSTAGKHTARSSGVYSLVVQDDCAQQLFEWDLEINREISAEDLAMANIFSPNGDGVNDCFTTVLPGDIEPVEYYQWIYDRWGNLMFYSESPDYCWDGIFKNEPVVTGVFVYVIEMKVNSCTGTYDLEKVGDVTVIR